MVSAIAAFFKRSWTPSGAYEVSLWVRLKVPYDHMKARSIHPEMVPPFPGKAGNSACFDFFVFGYIIFDLSERIPAFFLYFFTVFFIGLQMADGEERTAKGE